MIQTRPGDYITAKCRRCNDITGHIVMLVLNGQIARVECKACGSTHKYWEKSSSLPAQKNSQTNMRLVKAGNNRASGIEIIPALPAVPRKSQPSRTIRSSAKKNESAWQEAMGRLDYLAPIQYSMDASFKINELISHPSFGKGVVLSVTKPDKMTVLFQEGVKILRCHHA